MVKGVIQTGNYITKKFMNEWTVIVKYNGTMLIRDEKLF